MTDLARALVDELDAAALDRLAELLAPRLEARMAPPADAAEVMLTASEAALRTGLHAETIRRAARTGKLYAGHAGRSVRIAPSDLDAWLSGADQDKPEPRPRARRPRRSARPSLADTFARLEQEATGVG
jgi:excisionase family DNA binding protein